MPEQLPEVPHERYKGGNNGEAKFLAIGHLHYHANDLDALARLAQEDRDLAHKVVEQRDTHTRLDHASYRFSVVSTSILGVFGISAVTLLLIKMGVIPGVVSIAAILAVGVLLRVITTGQWSDTTWMGKLIEFLIKSFGGSKPSTGQDDVNK